MPDRLEVRAGDAIEDLSFVILDENGDAIQMDDHWHKAKNATLLTSWSHAAPKGKKPAFPKDFSLPNITNVSVCMCVCFVSRCADAKIAKSASI